MKSPWPTKKLGEICKIRTGKKDVDEGNPKGKYPFFTCSREITCSDTYSFDTEAILIAGNGDVGNTKIYKGKFEAYQRTYVLDGFQEDIRYIYYYLIGNLKRILIQSKSGSTMPYIRKGDLANFEIPLPTLPIQQKIVRILDTIQSAIDIQEKIIEKTNELKKSLMAELFKYGGPSFRKGRKLKKTEIGEIPDDWEVVRIKDIGSVITGTTPPTSVKEFWDGEIPFVTPSDFENDSVYVYQTERKVTKAGAQKGRIIPKDSILVVCIGSTLGKIALSYEECITNQQINAIICENFNINPFFVYYFLLKNQGLLKAYAGTTTKPIVKKSLFEIFSIPLPPLPEQQEITEILQTIDQKIEIEKKKKELYEELFKTMLNKIMNQEIDVENIEV